MAEFIYPSAVAYKDVDLTWMVGRVVSQISPVEPIFWCFRFGPDASISVYCLWRIVENERIVLTSEDHGHQFGLPAPVDVVARITELLSGLHVAAVRLREATADMLIEFTDNLRLEIIPTSAGYESWLLRDPSGNSFVAQGGGEICRWKS
jgi:hypothetical protein